LTASPGGNPGFPKRECLARVAPGATFPIRKSAFISG
jgi:hypothetical protein